MSLLTNWGYAVTNVDALPEMLEGIEYDQFTADKYAGDKRTHSNIMAAESAIRNYCGWHIFPELDCRLDTTFFDRRVTIAGRYIMIQLPATYVTAVKSIQIAGVVYDETFVLDNNGILRIYDVNMCAIREYSKIVVEYTAGIPEELHQAFSLRRPAVYP